MKTSATVTLELLRREPSYPLLLAPVTEYQALCGNHPAETVRLPFQHRGFLQRLDALRYTSSRSATAAQAIHHIAEDLRAVLNQIPGLIADVAAVDPCAAGVIHLRLVLSPKELALLPWELAFAPNGFPAAGRSLSLQSVAPITIAREIRRRPGAQVEWPREPRILFAYAAPSPMPAVPAAAHLLELRRAIEPWIAPSEPPRDEAAQVNEVLTVLPQASLEDVRDACARRLYTHVHILAHGEPLAADADAAFGIALCKRNGRGKDVVNGGRLAGALRSHSTTGAAELSSPAVVTLASCDGGNVGKILIPGASVAHDLHEEGIAMVVASQFPLTAAGSVILTRSLYQRLLWGDDPRIILHDARQQLYQLAPEGHDWASLVVYLSLPTDIERQLEDIASSRARRAMGAAMSQAESDWNNSRHGPAKPSAARVGDEPHAERLQALERAMNHLPKRARREQSTVIAKVPRRVEEQGILGSVLKRRAWLHHLRAVQLLEQIVADEFWRASAERGETEPSKPEHARVELWSIEYERSRTAARDSLLQALNHYRDAFITDMSTHWGGVQYLSLAVILRIQPEPPEEHWEIAASSARLKSKLREDPLEQAYAYSSLIELVILDLARGRIVKTTSEKKARQYWKDFRCAARPHSSEMTATIRQLKRYQKWYAQSLQRKQREVAQKLLERFGCNKLQEIAPALKGLGQLPASAQELALENRLDDAAELASKIVARIRR
jgi:hypothetical protein